MAHIRQMLVFWHLMPHASVGWVWHSEGMRCLHH